MKDHGLLYVADGAVAQSLTTSPAKMTGFATNGPGSNAIGSNGVVPVVASDKITVVPGRYAVDFTVSGITSGAQDVQAVLNKGSTEIAQGQCRANFATGSADNCMGFSTIIILTDSDATNGVVDLSIYLEAGGSVDFTPVFSQFRVMKLD